MKNTRVLIIEDERPAADRLSELIRKADPAMEIAGILNSVKKSVEWIKAHPAPDLVFMDIQLADGLSFEIFGLTGLTSPVIFTTAYDEYALRAFKVNSIDYLLKPIDPEELKAALLKFHERYGRAGSRQPGIEASVFDNILQALTNRYKQRFAVKVGEHIRSIPVEDILYFYSFDKATFLHTTGNKNYVIDYTLEQVESLADPRQFFRINRKYILSFEAIKDIFAWSNSRLKIELIHGDDPDAIVSREKVNSFRKWLDR
jgi:DNA-binding LytR/AlgR family response regulator